MRASHAVFLALFMCVAVDGGRCAVDGTMRLACRTSRAAARLRGVDTKLVCTSVSWCGEWCTCYSFAALSACHHEGDVIFEVDVPWVISLCPTVRHPYTRVSCLHHHVVFVYCRWEGGCWKMCHFGAVLPSTCLRDGLCYVVRLVSCIHKIL